MNADAIILGLTQGDVTSIAIVAVAAVLALLLLGSIMKLSAAVMRIGCIVVLIGVFIFALTRLGG